MVSPESPLRLGVLLSGSGRTLQNLHELSAAGELPAQVAVVIASRADVKGVQRAHEAGAPCVIARPRDHDSPRAYGEHLGQVLRDHGVTLVVMAGFLHLWHIPDDLRGRVLNIHPALLPAFGGHGFYGDRVHRAVLAAGVKVSGCTVHYADNEYDQGPIILQRTVPVSAEDDVATLAQRVFAEECIAYPEAIRLHAAGRLRCEGRVVHVRQGPNTPAE